MEEILCLLFDMDIKIGQGEVVFLVYHYNDSRKNGIQYILYASTPDLIREAVASMQTIAQSP